MEFVDTHCHIQSIGQLVGEEHTRKLWEKLEDTSVDEVVAQSNQAGVARMICVGCDVADSELALECAEARDGLFASIGIHPHEAQHFVHDQDAQERFSALATAPKVVAVGECGLDYYYEHSPKDAQVRILEFQLELAKKHDLPVIFHVREAFDDFWPIFDRFEGLRGVLHSFTDNLANMQLAVSKGLYIGVNGISTFTKSEEQLAVYRAIPSDKLLLETDAPFLTPVPHRGKVCLPMNVIQTAEFLSRQRGESLETLSQETTKNAGSLFGF